MEMTHETAIHLLVRIVLGILFLFQGYDKLFNIKVAGVTEYFQSEMRNKNIPGFLLPLTAWFTSLAEFVGGLLIILGLFKTYALYLIGVDLIIVTAAFSLLKPMWDMNLVLPRLLLLIIALYLPSSSDMYSLDYIFHL